MAEHIDNAVRAWMVKASQAPLLSATEELELGRGVKNEDEAARNRLIESNLRLVISVAIKYIGQGNEFSDLVQNGNVGLIRAVEKYDYSRGYRFSTYATYWIKRCITRELSNSGRSIRLPVYITEMLTKLYQVSENLVQELGREPTPIELEQRSGLPYDVVDLFLSNNLDPISIESGDLCGSGDGWETYEDVIRDNTVPTPDEILHKMHLDTQIRDEMFYVLSPRERSILTLRFGLFGTAEHTLEETEKALRSVTSERIRQVEYRALAKIRNNFRWERLAEMVSSTK